MGSAFSLTQNCPCVRGGLKFYHDVGLFPVTVVDSFSLEKYCLVFLFQLLLMIVFVLWFWNALFFGSGMLVRNEVGPLNIEAPVI